MAGVYKEKTCPTCKILHRKRGIFCGASCAASSKTLTDQTKEKIADGLKEYYNTPEGIAQASINNRRVNNDKLGLPAPITIDEFVVDIPTIYELPDGYTTDF
jgi:hypothetical protein